MAYVVTSGIRHKVKNLCRGAGAGPDAATVSQNIHTSNVRHDYSTDAGGGCLQPSPSQSETVFVIGLNRHTLVTAITPLTRGTNKRLQPLSRYRGIAAALYLYPLHRAETRHQRRVLCPGLLWRHRGRITYQTQLALPLLEPFTGLTATLFQIAVIGILGIDR